MYKTTDYFLIPGPDSLHADGNRGAVLAVLPAAVCRSPTSLDRLTHEYGLKDEVNAAWAVRPRTLGQERGRLMLMLEDPGGEPLDRLLDALIETGCFLNLAISIALAVAKLHQRGHIHKDIKPSHRWRASRG